MHSGPAMELNLVSAPIISGNLRKIVHTWEIIS